MTVGWGAPKPTPPVRRVLRWTVPVDGKAHKIGGGQVIHVGMKNYLHSVEVWTVEAVNPDLTNVAPPRAVQVFGTGHDLPQVSAPLGSTIADELVWHVFEVAS